MDFEENNIEIIETSNDLDEKLNSKFNGNDNAVAVDDDYFDNDELNDDYIFNIPELSKVISYYGNSIDDKKWMCEKVKIDFNLDYLAPMISLNDEFKFMSSKIIESNESLNNYLDNYLFELKNSCQDINDGNENVNNDELINSIKDLIDENSMTTRLRTKTVTDTLYAGRIRYGMTNGRLNPHIIQLEGSFTLNHGEIIPLDLSNFKNRSNVDDNDNDRHEEFSLFPGKIVLLKGQNFTGNYISVTKFIDYYKLIAPDFLTKCPSVLLGQYSFNIVCACGPFFKFDPNSKVIQNPLDTSFMKIIFNYLKRYNPDVLLLFGPFYDDSHLDAIQQWSLQDVLLDDNSFPYQWNLERLFQHQIRTLMDMIMNHGRSIHTKIVIIPSSNELGQANVYPIFPKKMKFKNDYPNLFLKSFSNPAMLNIGGISVGVQSTDILLHLSRKEINNINTVNKKSKRLERLCQHILSHRHFYPLLPPDSSVNMEYPFYNQLSMIVTPHILILPSILRPFAFNINGTIVINPGKMIKNTMARIMLEPIKNEKDYNGSLYQYTNVEIINHKNL